MSEQQQLQTSDWKDISTDEAYRLSLAEFKGTTIQALQDLKQDIAEIKHDNSVRNYITLSIGGIAGIAASILTSLGMRH